MNTPEQDSLAGNGTSFAATAVFGSARSPSLLANDDATAGKTHPSRQSTRMANNAAPARTLEGLLDAFQQNRPWHPDHRKFNKAEFEKDAADHAEKHNLADRAPIKPKRCTCGGGSGAEGGKYVTIENVALFKDVTFFLDPVLLQVHSVINQFMCETMEAMGYVKIHVVHHTAMATLPKTPVKQQEDPESAPAPTVVKLPTADKNGKIPTMWKKDDETHAESVVRSFEEKFISIDNHKRTHLFSPLWKWTKELRKANNITDSNFTNWCKIYYYVRKIKAQHDPTTISDNYTTLRTLATKHNPAAARNDRQRVDWWAEACAVANDKLSSQE